MGNLFGKKEEMRIIFQGLDAAGKTSMLYRLKLGEVVTTIPTIGFNVETVHFKNIFLTCWDIGGRGKIRPLYRHYYQNTQGIVLVIDSNDKERLEEAFDEFIKHALLEEELKDTVVMVMANKQDLPGAMSAQKIEDALKEKFIFSKKTGQTVFVVPCSVTTGEGIFEAFDYFSHQLRLKKEGKAEPGLISLSQQAAQTQLESTDQSKEGTLALKALFKNPIGYFKSLFY